MQLFTDLPEVHEDHPRYKLISQGKSSLSDLDVLALALGGNKYSMDYANILYSACEGNVGKLSKMSIGELTALPRISKNVAMQATGIAEMVRRMSPYRNSSELRQISCSRDAFNVIASNLYDLPHEEFWVVLLNRANRVIAKAQISRGGVDGTVVDCKLVFKKALEVGACSIVLAHNHPSGNRNPSQADIDLTKKLVAAGGLLDILVVDHVIVADGVYYSFADEGLI